METINILLYTDTPAIRKDPNPNSWGVTDLEKFLKLKLQGTADVCLDVVNRHEADPKGREKNAANKLTGDLLKKYDEIWFFGYRQVNLPDAETPEPDNELEVEEQNELLKWMTTGGVLMTGDHSNVDPRLSNSSCDDDDHDTFLTLGRAIGREVPRAGQLRDWQGPPTACASPLNLEASDTYNTQVGSDPCALDSSLEFQRDEFPQTIILVNPCSPHTILRKPGSNGDPFSPITRLPDHAHEGRIRIPEKLNNQWSGNVRPSVIAKGTDKRFTDKKRIYDLLAAYDGHESAGRIVADSSFHHYLNVNLSGLPSRKGGLPEPGTTLDEIAEFYRNVAYWLAPTKVRENIKEGLLFSLAKHPDINELRGNRPEAIGRAARSILAHDIGLSRISLLFQTSEFERSLTVSDHIFSYLYLAETTFPPDSFLHPQNLLGQLITAFQSSLLQLGFRELGWLEKSPLSVAEMLPQFVSLQLKSNPGFAGFLDKWIVGTDTTTI